MVESFDTLNSLEGTEIAIIGMAGRFPGAKDVDEFWSNLTHGIESISFFRDDEINLTGLDPAILKDPHYVKAAGMLEGVEDFDADFFGFYPREAEILDPQQRIFLECAWEALENAGYEPESYKGWIGVYAGSGMSTYLLYHLIANRDILESVHGYQLTISSDKDFLPTRVSYKLNLRGPSVNIQTACSTSLVATHLACQSLINYQCDMALAGGVSIRLPLKQGYLYQEGGINSPDGHCRAFDENAQGTVSGSGAGVIVLKRLADALAERDHIYAIIKGSAINNDGSMKVGYTAPSIEGQAEVIAMAQAIANVDPDKISYIEAHGTGTSLGDPIEISSLTQVFRTATERKQFCAIGSLKTNIGHLDAAAGVTGVIKTALALKYKQIPPSINFSNPNPKIDFENSPFYVNTELREWGVEKTPRIAGVSSFGIGGTNAHVILEEADFKNEDRPSRSCQMLMISARSEEALEHASSRLGKFLASSQDEQLADVAYTLQVGRKEFQYRKVILARSTQDAEKKLLKNSFENVFISTHSNGKPQVVFMFTGQGSQYVHMAKGLYEAENTFRKYFDQCANLLLPIVNVDLRRVVYPDISSTDDAAKDAANEILQQTNLAQPALFAVEYAMAQLLISWGIQPQVAIGHSIGEYVAATLAEVFSLEDALKTVATRGMLMQALPKGSMVSVSLSEPEILDYLDEDISLAAVNGPNLCVLSGDNTAIENLITRFQRDGIEFRKLKTSHAFHSKMMDPILEKFRELVANLDLHPPQLRFVSNLTGTWITPEQAMSPQYWTDHLRNTVRFASGIDELMKDPSVVFIETGPGRALSVFVKNHPAANLGRTILTTIRHPQDQQDDDIFFFASIAKLWLNGVKIGWDGFYEKEERKRIPLPTYPFERKRYWIEPDSSFIEKIGERKIVKRKKIQDWFYYPSWKKMPLLHGHPSPIDNADPTRWLLFLPTEQESQSFSEALFKQVKQTHDNVMIVRAGIEFQEIAPNIIEINPENENDYDQLIKNLSARNWLPDQIVHAWSCNESLELSSENQSVPLMDKGFFSLLFLSQAILRQWANLPVNLTVFTTRVFQVLGHEAIIPERATLVGLCLVIPQEIQNIRCKLVDFENTMDGLQNNTEQTHRLLQECIANADDKLVSYRNMSRWIQVYEPVSSWFSGGANTRLKKEGVYLISGGLGRIGLVYAKYLSRTLQAKIILMDRLAFPEREKWDDWLNAHESDNSTSLRIRSIIEIEANGGSVDVVLGDVSILADVFNAIDYVKQKFGVINGIIHSAGFVSADSIIPVQELKRADCAAHFAPKITGLRNISTVLNERTDIRENLNFVLLQSSLSTILGGLGLGAYAAANKFMDSFVTSEATEHSIPWLSVNWDGWNFNDAQIRNASRGIQKQAGSGIIELSLTPEEGTTAFELLLGQSELNQVIVSTGSLEERMRQWITRQDDESITSDQGKSPSRHSRPNLQTPYVEPTNDIEKNLTQIWEKVLGISPIGTYDDFFELGGHSLLATQLMTRLRDQFAVDLPLRRLFETPTIHGISLLIETAQSDKVDASLIPIQRIPRDGELLLSFGQQRLWFLEQLEPGSTLYNNFTAIRLTGDLNFEALKSSLNSIIDRHEVLRTVFTEVKGHPVQVILPSLDCPIKVIDLADIEATNVDRSIAQVAIMEVKQPFNLGTGPLLRLVLLKISPTETILFLIAHHIVSDGWSVTVMVQELAAYYSAYNRHEIIQLPELIIQYADYAAWQRQWFYGDILENQENYWLGQLKNLPSSIDLVTDFPRPAVQTSNGANIWFEIPEKLSRSLQNLGQKEGTTLFMVLMAALNILLIRYTGQEDLVVGTPVANRNRMEIEPLIGFLLNILVIRSDVSGDPTFHELLNRVKEVSLGAFANQDYPFEMLVDKLQPERDMSRSPLFQVIFDLQDATQQTLELPGLEITPVRIDIGTTKYDLALSMEDHGSYLSGYINYNTDLFRKDTISRLLEHFIRILQAVGDLPEIKVSRIPLLSEEEKDAIIYKWNNNILNIDTYQSIGKMIETNASIDPGAIAVMDSTHSITYRQFDQISNQIAQQLRRRHCERGDVVGLFMERSTDAIVSLLGILKAGCVYLPLDPGAPDERIKFILKDAGANCILSEYAQLHRISQVLPDDFNRDKIFQFDSLVNPNNESGNYDLSNEMDPNKLAYIIYTSGSTGQPKGVMIAHQALSNHCRVMKEQFQITPTDNVLQFSAYSFDQSIEQILVTLISGATLFIRGPEIWTPEEFIRVIDEQQLTVVNIQPAYWLQWAQAAMMKTPPVAQSLKLVIIGGDAILPEHIHLWSKTPMKGIRLLNAYGPTETTITASTFEILVDDDVLSDAFRVPIGKPLPNRWFYALDKLHQPVPIGVPGELYISGDGLAMGYINQPEMTAERFIINPFYNHLPAVDQPGQKMYRSGDLVRYLPSGDVEFLGRVDTQVKVRGFRIELGEIETILEAYPHIREAVVLAREGKTSPSPKNETKSILSEKRLVAYLTLKANVEKDEIILNDLREYIKSRLPAYMIPSAFIILDTIPQTISGKVDRKALAQIPVSDELHTSVVNAYVTPRTPVEAELASIWSEVLGVEKVGVFDNFFELGGHSLLATQLISRIRDTYHVDLPLRKLFESPTIDTISTVIAQNLVNQIQTPDADDEIRSLMAELDTLSDEEILKLLGDSQ
jgi:amino acid adenylation domain-containing protein